MLVTGLMLAPMATATIPAMQDFADLRTVINAAASAIGDPNNSNRGFGFNWPGSSNQMGTADLVNNITSTILRGKFQLDTNKVHSYLQFVLYELGVDTSDYRPRGSLQLHPSMSLLPSTAQHLQLKPRPHSL